jgi:hypothetical protein
MSVEDELDKLWEAIGELQDAIAEIESRIYFLK